MTRFEVQVSRFREGRKSEMVKQELIKGLGSYGNECTRARIQLPRPTEEKLEKGTKVSTRV